MATNDPGEIRLFNNERRRHEDAAQALIRTIAENAELLKRDATNTVNRDGWAKTIHDSAEQLLTRFARLDSLTAVESIIGTEE